MSSRKQADKSTQRPSRTRTREAALFIARTCALLLLLAAVGLAKPLWQSWQSREVIEIQIDQMIRQEGSFMYRDEMLTMSAKMAAATNDLTWVTRYEESNPRIRPTIKESSDVSESHMTGADAFLAAFACDKLVGMEQEALELVRQGNHEHAATLLQSPEYEDQHHAYRRSMEAFVYNTRRTLEGQRDRNWKRIQWSATAIALILPAIALIWFVAHQVGKRLAKPAKTKRHRSAFGREWQETFNAITDGVCIIDRKRRKILQCNKAMTQFLAKPHNEIIGRSCCELLHGSSEPIKRCPLVRMFETRRSETTDFQVDDRWLRIKADPLIDNNGHLVGAVHILSDITEHRKAGEALQESENKFRLAFANAQDAIVWIDGESGVITNCNKATERLFGKQKDQIIGQHHTILYPKSEPENHGSLLGRSSRNLNGSIQAEILTKGGDTRIVTVSVSRMFVEGKEIVQGIMRDITERKKAIEEVENLAKFPSEDPNPVLRISENRRILYANDASAPVLETWKSQIGQPLPEPWAKRIDEVHHSGCSATFELDCDDGHVFFMTLQPIVKSDYVNVYGLDITKLRKAEREKMDLELHLRQRQKMEAIGTLAGGIAHDFNNILAAMRGYLELSLDDLSEDSPIRNNLEQILSCSDRAAKLVKQILTFSREDQEEREKEPIQVSLIVKEVLGMLRSSLPTTIKICRRIRADSSIVLADPTQIHQVLVNLCTNAAHAMGETGGLLEVSLIDVDFESEVIIGDEHLARGSYVKLSVRDTGCGMDKAILERVFEPFFTTKKADEGTGLGLSVVHGIVKSHKGAITVKSTPGEGATFDIFLPKIEDGVVEEPQSSEPAGRESEVILLVDDEEMMIDVTRQILERLGFDVVAKISSVEALEAFQEEPDRFDLVITDQVMPNMTGTQLAKRLISIRPDIPVILCSGFPENVSLEEVERIGIKKFISKPIGKEEIAETVWSVIGRRQMTV